jgi:hypothetical protein
MNGNKLSAEMMNLIAFLSVIVAIIILAKVGTGESPGVDLSIMTALIAVAGSLANNFRKSQPVGVENAKTVNQGGNGNGMDQE